VGYRGSAAFWIDRAVRCSKIILVATRREVLS
jgi:hypothetical protein